MKTTFCNFTKLGKEMDSSRSHKIELIKVIEKQLESKTSASAERDVLEPTKTCSARQRENSTGRSSLPFRVFTRVGEMPAYLFDHARGMQGSRKRPRAYRKLRTTGVNQEASESQTVAAASFTEKRGQDSSRCGKDLFALESI